MGGDSAGNGGTLPIPAPAHVDARHRAWRTFVQGLLSWVAICVAPVLLYAAGNLRWTSAYWVGIGVSLLTAVVTAVLSYVGRFLAPPDTS